MERGVPWARIALASLTLVIGWGASHPAAAMPTQARRPAMVKTPWVPPGNSTSRQSPPEASPRPLLDPHESLVPAQPPAETHINTQRVTLWGVTNVVSMVKAYEMSQGAWGHSTGKFHFKHDWSGDGMALSDETSHMFAAYHLQRVLNSGYRWSGFSPGASRRLATLQAWLWMFAVEYPIDAYNPHQGFGVSDLAFNTVGVLAAHVRSTQTHPRWDIKISLKRRYFSGEKTVIAYSNEDYDDYIYWLTMRPTTYRYLPLHLGIGYATNHEIGRTAKEIRIGVGTSLDDIGAMISEPLGRYLKPLSFFFFNLDGKIVWR